MYFEQSYFLSLKPFPAAGLFLYPLKKLEKQTSSDVFRGIERDQLQWHVQEDVELM